MQQLSDPCQPHPLLDRLLTRAARRERLTHVEYLPPRAGRAVPWPAWVPDRLRRRLQQSGIDEPWEHQVRAAELAWSGHSVIAATGTGSGKSLMYLMPAVSAVLRGEPPHADAAGRGPGGLSGAARPTVLYLAPTKALAADQLSTLRGLRLTGLRAASYDGDTPTTERERVRAQANYVLTNPDMLHHSVLPQYGRWSSFLRGLRYVVVDDCHGYRGVFGAHVAQILRRLRRVCARYGAEPTFVLVSATVSEPGGFAERLTGLSATRVTEDAAPAGATAFALWQPPLSEDTGENGAPIRRSTITEAGEALADLVASDVSTLVFTRSRRGAEAVSLAARRELAGGPADRVAAYRGGYLPEERRELEQGLRSGRLAGLAATNALELGIDIAGLDAVVLAGWPGTRASMWQQAGRAGRAGQEALAILMARDDPLDTYLVHHPEALFGQPVEAAVLDADNPYVLSPHLCAAASELPLTGSELALFGPNAEELVRDLTARGMLRARPGGWYWTRRDRASDLTDIRGGGGAPVHLVEASTGTLLGSVDEPAAHGTAHAGAVYLHQGKPYLVRRLDLDERVALLDPADPDYVTFARDVTDIRLQRVLRSERWGKGTVGFGAVEVTRQVVSYLRRRVHTGEVLGEEPLDMPARTMYTRAVWWTVSGAGLASLEGVDLPGAAHAAEHASIGLLPLFATCDRWDVGGVSTADHPDTGRLTVFVYDGNDGGAGFAERGYAVARPWLTATRRAIDSCGCESGCPSCIQSPKCGNRNDPLDKHGAIRLLDTVLPDYG